MGKKRLLALMCAVSILLTTFMPLSALGDEGVGELVVTETLTEEVVSLSEPADDAIEDIADPVDSANNGDGNNNSNTNNDDNSNGSNNGGDTNNSYNSNNNNVGNQGNTNPTPPSFPTIWDVYNNRGNGNIKIGSVWKGSTIDFTINVSLRENEVICMYDANSMTDPSNTPNVPNPLFGSEKYWQLSGETSYSDKQMLFDSMSKLWSVQGFCQNTAGSFKYAWRIYAADDAGNLLDKNGYVVNSFNDAYYYDYMASDGSSVIVYEPLLEPQYTIEPNNAVSTGNEVTMRLTTSSIVDKVSVVDENEQEIPSNFDCSINGNMKQWTVRFKFTSADTYLVTPRISATIGGETRSTKSQRYTTIRVEGQNTPGESSDPGETTPGSQETPAPSISGSIRAANVPSDSVVPGMNATLGVDIEYAKTNGNRINYTDIKFFDYVEYVEVWPEVTGSDFPFEAKDVEHILIKKSNIWEEKDDGTYEAKKNPAKFSFTMRARSDLANGNYPVNFAIRYKLKDQDEQQVNNAVIGMLFIFGADDPNPTQEPSPTEKPDLGYVRFIQIPSISARAGDTVHLDMGVEFAASDGKRYSYTDADFYKYVDYIEIQPEITDTYPFVADGNINRKIIHSQSEALSSPFKYDMQVKSTLGAGTHTFNFTLRYRLKGSTGAEPDKTETCMLFVSEPAQPTVDPQAGYVRFAQMPNANAKVGESLTLDLGVEFASSDGQRFSYTDPEFYKYVDYIEIQPEITDNYPFVVTDELSRKIIRSLEDAQTNPFTYGVQVKKSLTNGAYTFNFTLRYRLKGKAEPEADKTEAGMVFVTGAKTSTGGGGGGGGGVSLPDPQAKLIVDSLTTDPSVPQAGDTFDVKLMLKNTNEKQYIQNIKVSYTVDNDVLLPANGSSSFYIPKINAGEAYELVIPVTARPDMPDSPVKMNLTMEYEDKKVSSVSANQVVILNVKQVQKIKLDQLVLPQGEVLVGESASFTMNIINSGRTTLYNVSAAMLDNDMFTTGGSSYIGNLEAGASKQMELDIYPNAEGAIDGTVRVTYEDANGNQQYEDVPYSIYASPVDDGSDDINNPIIEPTPEPTYEISNILENLPWWVYGSAGLFVICIVMLLAVAAHRRKAASMMDYDDD